jgi:hypothetical protein
MCETLKGRHGQSVACDRPVSAIGTYLARAKRLDGRQWRMLAEAAAGLAAANVLLLARSFPRAIGFGAVPLGPRDGSVKVVGVVWAVKAAARRVPYRAACIEQGIVAQRMLRRSGIDATLHYGIAKDRTPGKLEAHVWVTVDDHPVLGGKEAPAFAPVAKFP